VKHYCGPVTSSRRSSKKVDAIPRLVACLRVGSVNSILKGGSRMILCSFRAKPGRYDMTVDASHLRSDAPTPIDELNPPFFSEVLSIFEDTTVN
jgi:hypothetical protein